MTPQETPKLNKTSFNTDWDMFRLYAGQQHGGYGSIPDFVATTTTRVSNKNTQNAAQGHRRFPQNKL
jgi:hypothetical protein